jgi:hypothetical protein
MPHQVAAMHRNVTFRQSSAHQMDLLGNYFALSA